MYVCMSVCVYVCRYVCIYACMYVCKYLVCVVTRVSMYALRVCVWWMRPHTGVSVCVFFVHAVYLGRSLSFLLYFITATHCNTMQHTTTHCTLQHTRALASQLPAAFYHCNTLQHTTAPFNTLPTLQRTWALASASCSSLSLLSALLRMSWYGCVCVCGWERER